MMKTISGRLLVILVLLLTAVSGGVGILYSGVTRHFFIREQCKMLDEVYELLLQEDIPALCEEENRIKELASEDEWEEPSDSLLEPYENNNLRFRIRDGEFKLLYATNKSSQTGVNTLDEEQTRRRMERYQENAKAEYEGKANGGRVVLRGIRVQGDDTFYIQIIQSSFVINRSTAYARRVLFLVIALFLVFGTVCVRMLSREIGRSVGDAARVAQKIADKDFSEKASETTKYRDLNELGASINEMSGQIQSYVQDLETYNRLLQQDNQRRAELEQHRKRFVNNVSHELKTPLAIMSGQMELLSMAQDAEKRQQYCDSAMEEVQRMNEMVSSMLQIFSVEEGLELFPMERMDLGSVAKTAFQDFLPLFEKRGIQAEYTQTSDCLVNGNPENLRRAVSNFLMNAYRYAPEGSQVRAAVSLNGSYVLFSVYNDGEQIVGKDMDRIWDSFYQGDAIGREHDEGTGLGLYIVKSIVSQHGGACGLENREHGVEFWFGIPHLMSQPEEAGQREKPDANPHNSGETPNKEQTQ